MNDQINDTDGEEQLDEKVTQLAMLKQRADMLGISYSNNISVETLRKRIADKLEGREDQLESGSRRVEAAKTKAQIEHETRKMQLDEQLALVRCQIYNLNPSKTDLRGEIIAVANKFVGTVRKFIPFGEETESGYHVPRILFEHLKTRKFQQIKTRVKNGQIQVDTRLVPEFNLVELPPLTEAELAELAAAQAAAERVNPN